MVNEERLRHLIKIAKFDANDGKPCKPMIQYARKDYVSMQMLQSFVTGTITYGLILVIWALYSMESLMKGINTRELSGLLITLIVLYLIFMLAYFAATYVVFQIKYTDGRRKVKKYYSSLKKVSQMYEREEHLKPQGRKD